MAYTQPTVYARHEPTNDSVAIKHLDSNTLATCKDVIIYHDRDCRRFYANFPWFYKRSIDLANKYVKQGALPTYLTHDEFERLKKQSYIYHYGHTWCEFKPSFFLICGRDILKHRR
jgi:hypothetical protein